MSTSSSSDSGPRSAALPLPPLALPPRQQKKIEVSCKKWLARFLSTVRATAQARREDSRRSERDDGDIVQLEARCFVPWHTATGFVALNGGILAGCTPYDVRETLMAQELLQPPPTPTVPVFKYSSTLPFVLCDRPLALSAAQRHLSRDAHDSTAGASVWSTYVPAKELDPYVASAQSPRDAGRCVSTTGQLVQAHGRGTHVSASADGAAVNTSEATEKCGRRRSGVTIGVVVLQLAPSAPLWKGGSASATASANKGCGFLYLVPCDAVVVLSAMAHVFQRPIVGVDTIVAEACLGKTMVGCTPASQLCDSSSTAATLDRHPTSPAACVSTPVRDIPGLYLVEDFLTPAEAAVIWAELCEERRTLQLEYLSRRRVAHFNRRFIYGVNELTQVGVEVNAQPRFYDWMKARLQNSDARRPIAGDYPILPGTYECDQLTVNYYDYQEMGACGIATHVDAHGAFDDAIFLVSLGSYTVMDFARWDTPAEVQAPTGVYLAPNSLAVMTGEARYGWTHCIVEKRTDTLSELVPTCTRGDRVSLTWRRGRTQPHNKSQCAFSALCDGQA